MARDPERRVHLADWGSAAVVLAAAVAHLRFMVVDQRLPKDMGLYYKELPHVWISLGDPSSWLDAAMTLASPGGWYVVLLALIMRVVGRAPEVMAAVDLGWMTLALTMGALAGRRLGGPRAGLAAVSLLATPAMVVVMARTSWIHIPELALVLTALVALLIDPELHTRRWTAVVAVSCALAVALRPSGLVWVATLAPLLLPAWRAHRARALSVALAVGTAGLVLASNLHAYMGAKLDARPRYAEQVPSLIEQLHPVMGPPTLLLGALGVALAWGHLRREHAVVLGAWLVVPVALVGIFLAGLDNFPFLCAGLALAGGVGLARSQYTTLAAVGTFALLHSAQYVSLPHALAAPWYTLTGHNIGPGPENLQRPYQGFSDDDVLSLVYSTCDPRTPCTLVVDQGLFRPYTEEPGRHELFLSELDHVHLVSITGGDQPVRMDAMVNYDCGERDLLWRQRYPRSIDALMALVARDGLEPAWEGDTLPGCRLLWLTPGGEVPRPELLPEAVVGGAPGAGFSPDHLSSPRQQQGPPLALDGAPLLGPDGQPLPPPPEGGPPVGPDGVPLVGPDGKPLPTPTGPPPQGPPPHGEEGHPSGPPDGPRLPEGTPQQPPGEAPRPDGITKPVHLGEVPRPGPDADPRDELEKHRVRPGHSKEDR